MKANKLHYYFNKVLKIEECTFTLKSDKILYYYCNINDKEYQLGLVGNIPTNYFLSNLLL